MDIHLVHGVSCLEIRHEGDFLKGIFAQSYRAESPGENAESAVSLLWFATYILSEVVLQHLYVGAPS